MEGILQTKVCDQPIHLRTEDVCCYIQVGLSTGAVDELVIEVGTPQVSHQNLLGFSTECLQRLLFQLIPHTIIRSTQQFNNQCEMPILQEMHFINNQTEPSHLTENKSGSMLRILFWHDLCFDCFQKKPVPNWLPSCLHKLQSITIKCQTLESSYPLPFCPPMLPSVKFEQHRTKEKKEENCTVLLQSAVVLFRGGTAWEPYKENLQEAGNPGYIWCYVPYTQYTIYPILCGQCSC